MPKPVTSRKASAKKAPKQARSRHMTECILKGATRVLSDAGATGFTTNRVAEATGVSIGSLYQYYPNKAALLTELHQRDAEQLWQDLAACLQDVNIAPRLRFCRVVERCFSVQLSAHEHHAALKAAGEPAMTPEFQELGEQVIAALHAFLAAASAPGDLEFKARFCFTILTATLGRLASEPVAPAEGERTAQATATMLADYLGL
jgi:AcrR family transcriptional regulator